MVGSYASRCLNDLYSLIAEIHGNWIGCLGEFTDAIGVIGVRGIFCGKRSEFRFIHLNSTFDSRFLSRNQEYSVHKSHMHWSSQTVESSLIPTCGSGLCPIRTAELTSRKMIHSDVISNEHLFFLKIFFYLIIFPSTHLDTHCQKHFTTETHQFSQSYSLSRKPLPSATHPILPSLLLYFVCGALFVKKLANISTHLVYQPTLSLL